jgi:heme/copper-type cytochrome/quinol oxidase subunit 2
MWILHEDANRPARFRHHIVSEFVWATIPILMILAAAFPAVRLVVSSETG